MNNNILLPLVILLLANQISAYCLYNPPPVGDPGGDSQAAVCTYMGQTFFPGEAWDTENCEECHCDESGAFDCCGFGFNAAVMGFGVGCRLHRFDCLNGVVIDDGDIGVCEMAGTEIHLTRSK